MLGYKIGLLLVVTVISSSLISESFAEEILIDFDKTEYDTGDILTLSGTILDFTMPMVALSIYDPDGQILSANNIELDENGNFSKLISLDSPFYDKPGIYTVEINYRQTSLEEFFIISGEIFEPEPILKESIKPEIILLTTDKDVYTDGDVVVISGIVSSLESPTVLIGIYDTFGTPAGFYFGNVDKNLEFSTSFLVKAGVNFKVDGEYSIKAHYAESEYTAFFEYYENIQEPTDDNESTKTKPTDDNESTKTKLPNKNPIKPNENEKINQKDTTKKSTSKNKQKSSDNLSVEDIELGKMLNQINLECDRSKYTDTISYYDGMGPALYRLCKFESSIQIFTESLLKDPYNVEILSNKGSALGKLGYRNEAILHYDRAIDLDPNFLPAKNNKANILANLGEHEKAISLYAEILGKNPSYTTARQNLELVLSELPEKQMQPIPKQEIKKSNENIINEKIPIETNQKAKPQQEKPTDFFDQLGSVFSSFGSLFGILD